MHLCLIFAGLRGEIRWVVEPNSDPHRISRPTMQDIIWLDRIDVPLSLEFVLSRCRPWCDRPNAGQRRMLEEMSRAAFCPSFRPTAEVQRGMLVRERYGRYLGKCGIDGWFRHRTSGGDQRSRTFSPKNEKNENILNRCRQRRRSRWNMPKEQPLRD